MSRGSRISSSDGPTGPPEPLSVVEDLDPDPPGSAAKWRAREVVLGLVLLLGVLAWALGSWWHDESNRSHYEEGGQAAAEHRWEDALADYSAAKGYKDADLLTENATKQILERDRQYDLAMRQSDRGPAALVLEAARAVQTIQPGYKDVDTIAARAEDRVYTGALSGTVVMRTGAQPPGLYFRGAGGWHYLPGSDPWSSVLSYPLSDAAQKYIVYDVPGPGWTAPTPTPTAGPDSSQSVYRIEEGSPDKAGRRLMLATLPDGAGEPSFRSLNHDPAEYNLYICGAAGVWAVRYGGDRDGGGSVLARGGFGYIGRLEYEPTGPASVPRGVALPGTDDTVADFGHRSDMLLLAGYGPRVNDKTNSVLYTAKGDGSLPRAVYWTTGTLVSAALSPDDRYALVVVAGAPQDVVGKATVSALLVDLESVGTGAPVPPVILKEIVMDGINTIAGVRFALVGQLTISGVFLEKGAFEHKLLLGWYDGPSATSATVKLVDIRHPLEALCETTVQYADQSYLPVVEQDDGRTLLLFAQSFRPAAGPESPLGMELRVLQLDSGADGATPIATVTTGSYQVPLPQGNVRYGNIRYLFNPMLRGANLVYGTEIYDGASGRIESNEYSIPLAAAQSRPGEPAEPMLIFNTMLPAGRPAGQDTARNGIAGPGDYAYTDAQGTLHARTYDGTVDVPLEKGVGAIVELKTTAYYKALR